MPTGNLTIIRTSQYANKARKIHLYVDGKKMYSAANNEQVTLTLEEGRHTIYAQIDWCKTIEQDVTIQHGKEKRLELGCIMNNWSIFDSFVSACLCLGGIYLSAYLQNDFIFWISVLGVPLHALAKYFTTGEKPLFYYFTLGRTEYLYLEDHKLKASYRIYSVS